MSKDKLIVVPFSGTYGNPWFESEYEWDCSFKEIFEEFAKQYVPAWSEEFKYVTGLDLHLTFDSVEMPREYNFTNDRIFATMPFNDLGKMVKHLKGEDGNYPELDDVCRARHTSYDGFCSFYSSDWREWGIMSEWDHNQIESVILACLKKEGVDEYEVEREVMDVSCVREAIENHIIYAEEHEA